MQPEPWFGALLLLLTAPKGLGWQGRGSALVVGTCRDCLGRAGRGGMPAGARAGSCFCPSLGLPPNVTEVPGVTGNGRDSSR